MVYKGLKPSKSSHTLFATDPYKVERNIWETQLNGDFDDCEI